MKNKKRRYSNATQETVAKLKHELTVRDKALELTSIRIDYLSDRLEGAGYFVKQTNSEYFILLARKWLGKGKGRKND